MRKTRFLLWGLAVVALGAMAVSSGVCEKEAPATKDYYSQIEQFMNVLSIVQSDYVDGEQLDPKKLIYGAMEGMISNLDPYSQFMEPDEYREMKQETEGEFGGLGIEIAIKDSLLTIVAPIEDTPAAKAGIMAGDRIVKIDGNSTKDIKLNEAVKKLRGRPGTNVTITVLREEERKLLDFTITRALIKIQSIKDARIIEDKDKIGYIKLVEFQEKTAQDLGSALSKLKSQDMQSLILDLRNNPGGLLESAVSVSGEFIPRGETVVSTRGRVEGQNSVFKSKGRDLYIDMPMVVLVDKGSASASEIVAGAIQDHRRGIIMGAKTFGKGSVQTVIPLRDGSALRLTTAKYYTPANKIIHGEGIVPDVVVDKEKLLPQEEKDIFQEIESKDAKSTEPYDGQLARAVDLLKGMKVYKDFLRADEK